MKILSTLSGLILFLAGIYLTYWVFLDFEGFTKLYIGLYLGASLLLMTLGFYLILLPFALKSKKLITSKQKIDSKFDTPNPEMIDSQDEQMNEISETDALKIIQDEGDDEKLIIPTEDMQLINESNNIDETLTTVEVIQPINLDMPTSLFTNETIQFKLNEQFETIELRVIGIDAWTSQSVIRKLTEQSLLEISQKNKSGISMTQVIYKTKLIGYISRLDMNKVVEKMEELVDVTPATIVKEGRKVEHFSVNLRFNTNGVAHE